MKELGFFEVQEYKGGKESFLEHFKHDDKERLKNRQSWKWADWFENGGHCLGVTLVTWTK